MFVYRSVINLNWLTNTCGSKWRSHWKCLQITSNAIEAFSSSILNLIFIIFLKQGLYSYFYELIYIRFYHDEQNHIYLLVLENSGLSTTNVLFEKFKFCFSSQLSNCFISEEQSLHHGSTLFGDSCNTSIHFDVFNFKI